MDKSSVDVVLCAQVLQFLDKPVDELREMRRILKPEASLYVSLWCDLDQSPYFDGLVGAVATHISKDTAAGLGSAFNLHRETLFMNINIIERGSYIGN